VSSESDRPGRTCGQKNITPFDDNSIAGILAEKFPLAAGQTGQSGSSTPTEVFMQFLTSPYSIATMGGVGDDYTNLYSLTPADLSARLSLVISTYWQISLAPGIYNTGLPANVMAAGVNGTNEDEVLAANGFIALNSKAHRAVARPIWVCNFVWAGLLFASSIILLIVSIAGLVVKLRTRGPDMLGFVSSLTCDNVHVPLQGGGAILGMERSRLLKDMRMKLGDVKACEEVGHIAFGMDGIHVGDLKKSRLYN